MYIGAKLWVVFEHPFELLLQSCHFDVPLRNFPVNNYPFSSLIQIYFYILGKIDQSLNQLTHLVVAHQIFVRSGALTISLQETCAHLVAPQTLYVLCHVRHDLGV